MQRCGQQRGGGGAEGLGGAGGEGGEGDLDPAVDADGGDGGTAVAAEFVGAAKVLQFLGVVRAGGRRGDTVSRLFYPH